MPSINHVILMGHLTRDIELRYSQNGMAIAGFCIAINSGKGENKKAGFYNCKAFGKTAEWLCQSQPKKGSLVQVEGRLDQETWTDKESGQKREKIVVVANQAWHLKTVSLDYVADESDGNGIVPATGIPGSDIPF